MGKMFDIDDFYKRYMFHATEKAEAEFNQIIREIKKTESTSKDSSITQSKNDSAEMTIDDVKMQLVMQRTFTIGKDYNAIEAALDILHKYQKIQKIAKEWNVKTKNDMNSFDSMMQIAEVIGIYENDD